MSGLWDCERSGEGSTSTINLPAFGEVTFGESDSSDPVNGSTFITGFLLGGIIVLIGILVIILSAFLILRARRS
jgi:hypothetical protein